LPANAYRAIIPEHVPPYPVSSAVSPHSSLGQASGVVFLTLHLQGT